MTMSTLLKDSNAALKCIEAKAHAKSTNVSRNTKQRIETAAKIAQERIKHNNHIYAASAIQASKFILGE